MARAGTKNGMYGTTGPKEWRNLSGICKGFHGKHSDETKEKIRQGHLGKKLTPEHIDKLRQARKKQVIIHSDETKKKLREAGLRRMTREGKKKGYTNIEKIIYNYLKETGTYFIKQKVINDKFMVDAFIPKKNLIIECDGKFWHSIDRVVKKDKAENAYLAKCGFAVLRLDEDEILNGSFKERLVI